MWIVWIILIFSSASFYYATVKNNRFEEILPITTLSIILILYILGLFEQLKWGMPTIYTVTVAFYIFGIMSIIKKKNFKQTLENMITPGYLLFLLFLAFFYITGYNKMYFFWDDFSHWGSAVKSMYFLDALSTNPASNLTFASYPPGSTLFEYFFMKVRGQYVEGVAIIGYCMLIINPLLYYARKLSWDNLKFFLIWFIIILFLPTLIFSWNGSALQVDSSVGIFFGISMASVLLKDKWTKLNIINITLILFTLCLLKTVGFQLALITISYMIVDFFINNKSIIKDKLYKNKETIKWLLVILLTIFVVLVARISWKAKVKNTNTPTMFEQNINIKESIKAFMGVSEKEYRNETVRIFLNKILTQKIIGMSDFIKYENELRMPNLKYIEFVIVLLVISYIIYKKAKATDDFRKRYVLMQIIFLIGLTLYTIGLLLIYLFRFPPIEAIAFASYTRYIGIYFLGIMTTIVILFLTRYTYYKKNYTNYIINIILIVTLLSLFCNQIYNSVGVHMELLSNSRLKISKDVADIKKKIHFNSKEKIYVVWQKQKRDDDFPEHGYVYWVLRQEFWPYIINKNERINFGSNTEIEDRYTYTEVPSEWIKEISNYKYLYVYRTDDIFNNYYAKYLGKEKVEDNRLYVIIKTNGKLKLEEVIN